MTAPTPDPPPAAPAVPASQFTLYNNSGSSLASQPVTLALAFQPGDIPSSSKVQLRTSDGSPIATQEDGCSKWNQDGSRKVCSISFIEPDSIPAGGSVVYQFAASSGAPNASAKLQTAAITAHTNICVKTSNLTELGGAPESGTWDLICLNNVLTNFAQFSTGTGYGSNPAGGWDVYASGPARYGIHAFQYARRESDGAIHNWLRTDMWVDFWGSGSSPCPCSVAIQVSQPNSFGPIAGGSVGSLPEGGYVFGAQLLNGSNVIYNLGGAGDSRVSTVSFNSTSGTVTFSGQSASWVENTAGVFGVVFSGGTLPSGLSANTPYYFATSGQNAPVTDTFQLYPNLCAATKACSVPAVSFSNNGSGSTTATPMVITTPFSGFLGLDKTGQRFWIGASGTAGSPPPLLTGQDFGYLTQKSRAVPPYITSLFGQLLPLTGPAYTYYPGTYYFPWDMNTTGDSPGDERIGYINHTGAYSLFMPNDPIAGQNSLVIAASFSLEHMYHLDESVGLPDVFNNGPAKNGTTYPTLGPVQPKQRTPPYVIAKSPWLVASSATADQGPIIERYTQWLDASHMPAPQQAPFLKSGQPEWEAQLVQEANAIVGTTLFPSTTLGTNTYYRVLAPALYNDGSANQQTRGVAWGRRTGDMADFFQPADSPIAAYLHDLVADDVAYMDDFASNGTSAAEKSLGYFWNDIRQGNTTYQWWQDDFLFQVYGMNAWRGEYPHAASFLTNYFYKQVITRMDSASPVGGGGCLWAGPARMVNPFGSGNDPSTLQTSWSGLFANSAARGADSGWGTSWPGCAAETGGLIADSAGSKPGTPNGLASMMAASTAIGSLIGVPNSANLYAQIRARQYGGSCATCSVPLSFTSFRMGGQNISEPTFAIGPLGATN